MIPNTALRAAQIRKQTRAKFALEINCQIKVSFSQEANNSSHFAGILIPRFSVERNRFVQMGIFCEQIGGLLRHQH